MHRAIEHEVVTWNPEKGMITAAKEKRIGNVVLTSKPITQVPQEVKIKILCEAVRSEGLKLLNWDDTQREWQARVMSLKHWRNNEDWPDVTDENLLTTVNDWLAPYLTDVTNGKTLNDWIFQTFLWGYYPGTWAKTLTSLRRPGLRFRVVQ